MFYVLKSGCPWRLLPRDFPPWKTVYHWFRKWRIDGAWERLNTALRERLRAARAREIPAAQRGHRRLAVGQDHRCGRRSARI